MTPGRLTEREHWAGLPVRLTSQKSTDVHQKWFVPWWILRFHDWFLHPMIKALHW
jgi:hypothetical protein